MNTKKITTSIDVNLNSLKNTLTANNTSNTTNSKIQIDQIDIDIDDIKLNDSQKEMLKLYIKGQEVLLNEEKALSGLDEKFSQYMDLESRYGIASYGVNQSITYNTSNFYNGEVNLETDEIDSIYFDNTTEQFKTAVEKISKNYNMSTKDAFILIAGLDKTGACTYASTANEIFASYMNNKEQFEKDFGYPMTIEVDGQEVLNSVQLLADLYTFINHEDNGGEIIIRNEDGTSTINAGSAEFSDSKKYYLSTGAQIYLSSFPDGVNEEAINKFLKSKNPDLSFENSNDYIVSDGDKIKVLGPVTLKMPFISNVKSEKLKDDIKTALQDGKNINLSIYNEKNEITMKNLDNPEEIVSTRSFDDAGHAVFVTGATEDGVIVSSWGKRYTISYDELSEGSFTLSTSKIKGIGEN